MFYAISFNKCFDSGVIPSLENKGDTTDPINYRSITLINCLG